MTGIVTSGAAWIETVHILVPDNAGLARRGPLTRQGSMISMPAGNPSRSIVTA